MFNYKKLKEIREAHDMSQKEVAKLLNIAATTLSNYERGTRRPGYEFLKSYSVVFNIPMDTLLSDLNNDSINDGLDDYTAVKTLKQNFVILESEKIMALDYSELLKIKEYAELIYSKYRKPKGKHC